MTLDSDPLCKLSDLPVLRRPLLSLRADLLRCVFGKRFAGRELRRRDFGVQASLLRLEAVGLFDRFSVLAAEVEGLN